MRIMVAKRWSRATARDRATDWRELVKAHYDREEMEASPDERPAIDIYSL